MALQSIGDLAQSHANRLANARLKSQLNRLGNQLTTGRLAAPRMTLSGDVAPLAAIERSLTAIDAYRTSTRETATFLDTAQTALGTLSSQLEDLGPLMLNAGIGGDPVQPDSVAAEARARFGTMVSALNASVAGRSVFAGSATGAAPLPDGEALLADIAAAVGSPASASDLLSALDAYFDPGGGFDTTGYQGATTPLAELRLTPRDSASYAITAADPEIRASLKAVAGAALLDMGVLDRLQDHRRIVLSTAGQASASAASDMAGLRADLGATQARADAALTRLTAEGASLEIARNDLIGIDPYQTATELQETQARLETLYTVTARLQNLSLAAYL